MLMWGVGIPCLLAGMTHPMQVIMALSHQSPQVRREAAATLADIGSPGQGVEKLAELLADPNYEVRARAAMALGKAGEAAKPHVLKLVPLLEDDKAHVRQWAAWALAGLAAHAGDAAGELRRCLRDEDAEVRRAARYALERIKEKGR